nr:hypothetical protein [Patescibacteria group bacterium]
AIQPDKTVHRNGEVQSFSDCWQRQAEGMGHVPVLVDVRSSQVVETIASCDAFMWRPSPTAADRAIASRLIPAVEQIAQKPCFFNSNMLRGFEDKVAQYYELAFARLPIAKTEVFWTEELALNFCKSATYPMVLKLANGYQSSNVILLDDYHSAVHYIKMLFNSGTLSLAYKPATPFRNFLRRSRQAFNLLSGKYPNAPNAESDLQYGYLYLQEYLPNNHLDTRVTIIGNHAFAFRRFNREGDFRASGSGRIDFNNEGIDLSAIHLAYDAAAKLKIPVAAVDILKYGNENIVCEINMCFAAWAVSQCPGHWIKSIGNNSEPVLNYIEGRVDPEKIIFENFINSVLDTKLQK